ncbi:UNVERIFIED_CONTAM: hypothetical protein FKN15_064130 [Acipenser sinensis]
MPSMLCITVVPADLGEFLVSQVSASRSLIAFVPPFSLSTSLQIAIQTFSVEWQAVNELVAKAISCGDAESPPVAPHTCSRCAMIVFLIREWQAVNELVAKAISCGDAESPPVAPHTCSRCAMIVFLIETGRIDPHYPKVCGHQGNVLDIKWNPFIDNIIASCSEDTSGMKIKFEYFVKLLFSLFYTLRAFALRDCSSEWAAQRFICTSHC